MAMEAENIKIETLAEAKDEILACGCTKAGMEIMKYKAIFKVLKFKKVDVRGANILKQNFLSKGGEVVVSHHSCDFSHATTNILIMATVAQYKAVLPILMVQPWGVKDVAMGIKEYLANEGLL